MIKNCDPLVSLPELAEASWPLPEKIASGENSSLNLVDPSRLPVPVPSGGSVSVTSVGGITVNVAIASQIRGLLDAATAAGFNLRGGGYRSSAAQVATRRANCGPSYYDIYQKPASQCSPPTAIPGRSMHEQGRAIDFTSGGALITSRSNPAFVWLSNNASRFGMYNLPSEPWHWSTNGN